MFIDTSALLAILQDEPERRAFNEAIEAADSRLMSTATFVEVSIVVESRYGAEGLHDLDLFVDEAGIELVAVDAEQAKVARRVFSRFGKGGRAPHKWDAYSPLVTKRGKPPALLGESRSLTVPGAESRDPMSTAGFAEFKIPSPAGRPRVQRGAGVQSPDALATCDLPGALSLTRPEGKDKVAENRGLATDPFF